MNNFFSLKQISKTAKLGSNLTLRQYQLDLSASFMGIKSVNLKLGRNQIAKELGCSSSILQQYSNDINML